MMSEDDLNKLEEIQKLREEIQSLNQRLNELSLKTKREKVPTMSDVRIIVAVMTNVSILIS